jgi:hypothetical protein
MAERTFIPSSPACGQWETLLAEALDGLLKPADEATFSAHMAACPACSALFEEARRGREWLEFLSPEPEVPAGLLDKILARTGPGQTTDLGLAVAGGNVVPTLPAWQRPGFMGYIRRFAEPRLMMTAAMAFFSIALTLNLTGVHLRDLRPNSVRAYMERRLTMASTPIIRYYDHMRLVYEVQSTMRELRSSGEGDKQGEGEENRKKLQDAAPGESKQSPAHKEGGSRVDPPQQSIRPTLNDGDFLESSLAFQQEPAHSGGTRTEMRERSTVWTA